MTQRTGKRPIAPKLKAQKFDGSKAPLDLLARSWLTSVAQVMAFGAEKYAKHNWRSGIPDAQARYMAAAMRHILAHNEGEAIDPESGLLHLAHASCCLMFATELLQTHPELDGRFIKETPCKTPHKPGLKHSSKSSSTVESVHREEWLRRNLPPTNSK